MAILAAAHLACAFAAARASPSFLAFLAFCVGGFDGAAPQPWAPTLAPALALTTPTLALTSDPDPNHARPYLYLCPWPSPQARCSPSRPRSRRSCSPSRTNA